MNWYNRNILIPFVIEQRKNEVNYKWKEGLPISNALRCTYKIDSALPYLKYLNREDIQVLNEINDIDVLKFGACVTESWQENDVGKTQKCTAALLSSNALICQQDAVHLQQFRKELEDLKYQGKLIIGNKAQVNALYEVVRKVPKLYQRGFTSDRIRESFVMTGAISKGEETGQYYPIPNIDVMLSQCKVRNFLKEDKEKFERQASSYMTGNGFHTKEFFNRTATNYENVNVAPDTRISGEDSQKRDEYSLSQMHLKRYVILGHAEVHKRLETAREDERQ